MEKAIQFLSDQLEYYRVLSRKTATNRDELKKKLSVLEEEVGKIITLIAHEQAHLEVQQHNIDLLEDAISVLSIEVD